MQSRGRSPHVETMKPYVPAEPAGIVHRLDANEAPAWPHDDLRRIAHEALDEVALERYPDARARALKASLARFTGAAAESLVVGTGSDELIALLFETWNRPAPGAGRPVLVVPSPTFVMYRINAQLRGWDVVEVPSRPDWRPDVPALLEACERHRPNLVFLATPNNPTGLCLAPAEIEAIARAAPHGLVVADEAYVAFSAAPRVGARAAPNLLRMGTLSKIGLAALRVGWVEAGPDVVHALDSARAPFNTSAVSQAIAAAVLERGEGAIRAHCAAVVSERARVAARMAAVGGAAVHAGEANFLWVVPERAPGAVWQALVDKGVLVRAFTSYGGEVARGLRVSVGSREANDALLAAWPGAVGR
jgi:histidinol-phosphate aminotransferase